MWTLNHGEPGRGEGCTESIELRTQDENDTDFGSRRRWRICGSRRRCKSGVAPAVFGYGWWATPGGGGGSNVGAAQCIASEDLHSGHYATKELPGPATLTQWRTCFRLLRTSLIMLDAARLAALHGYQMAVERLSRTYPTAWHLLPGLPNPTDRAQKS